MYSSIPQAAAANFPIGRERLIATRRFLIQQTKYDMTISIPFYPHRHEINPSAGTA